ncbi:Predicted arabinose efflux permease, MFS family [Saccharopolyspora kobensis]|uniref:Predicted arabinose efflux permease, MFS family n=1 Tax=Saccharopolyspora kobensis TaxID=146035 RepID=A0A1H5U6B9_9PSEU|nr:MFS transporter [Saccharopolyspora kobensis]SEF70652.1 Predicted arabinose efflux permease, MFS family [Saccharopolyspora kobensis]SFC76721.1 Predicted arabinose efflux permease, MFS family [Saccharopolyspora kobensis]
MSGTDTATATGAPRDQRLVPRRMPRVLLPFRRSSYRRLSTALCFSLFTTGLWTVGQVWEVVRLGGGASQLSFVAAAASLGALLPMLLGGAIADRVAQKTILLVVQSAHTVLLTTAAVLSLTDRMQIWHLVVIAFLGGTAVAFYFPAYSAWLPALLAEEELMAANGFEGMVRPTIQQAAGPALGSLVISAFAPGAAMAVAAGTAFAAWCVFWTVPRTPLRGATRQARSVLGDVAEGFRYMLATRWLVASLLFASLMVMVTMGPLQVVLPFLIKDRLGGGAEQHALVLAMWGIGGAAGSLLMGSLRMPRRYLTTMIGLWGVASLPLLVVAVATDIWTVAAAAFAVGAMFSSPMVLWGTLLQRRVPPHLLGRITSLDFFVSLAFLPLSMAVAGPVSEAIGTRATFIVAGLVPLVAAVVAITLGRLPADEKAHPLSR